MHTTTSAPRGVILFAHGSRDPLWSAPIEAVGRHIQQHQGGAPIAVRCAYLELTAPDLPSAVQDLVDGGIRQITICPMFLGVGRHAREDLPALVQALRTAHPDTDIQVQSAIGEDPRMVALMASIACEPQ
ncbi:MAG: cobalamin biosynthesis protein CbiX [Burkholderiales bacterium 68-12]|nr:MAG: cobalamin biosynthesis protein CbiX [Burkholderiales bacterium 68-12]